MGSACLCQLTFKKEVLLVVKLNNKPKPVKGDKSEKGVRFVTEFRHWRSGKIIRAEDYGLRAFPIGSNGKKCSKG